MSMTLDEVINHVLEKAESLCGECAEEHRQLAEWLIELKDCRKIFLLKHRRLINLDYSFEALVREMRCTQKLYFKTRDKWALERSKELERQVDKMLAELEDARGQLIC